MWSAVWLLAVLSFGGAATAQSAESEGPAAAAVALEGLDLDELRIRLAPLPLAELEAALERILANLHAHSGELADALVERLQLARAPEPDDAAIAALDARLAALATRRTELVGVANQVIAAVEAKGGDASSARAYVTAIEGLEVAEPAASPGDEELDEAAVVRQRAAELVTLIRAEPPAHERVVPWEVPLSEFELELQPLPVASILERLEKWREMLQREVRKRVRIDILLNDSAKLKQTLARRVAAEGEAALSDEAIAAVASQLAQQSQEQQRIVNQIVKRMEVAIRLVERRGGDAEPFAKYIAASTGQRLNLTDPTVLRAQVLAWIRSPDGGVKIALNVAAFIGIVLAFWVLSLLLGGITAAAVRRTPRASSLLGPVLAGAVRRLTLLIGVVIGISMLGVNIGPLLAVIGAAGLVIGLALQGTLSNFASGVLILINRPYDVGHVIEAGGVLGKVEAMNLVSTSILTFDNKLMLVPNNEIWNGVITNVTGKPTRRVDLTFGIGYGDDAEKAIGIIRDVILSHPKVKVDPAPVIRVHELADSSVNIIARPWAATADYWDVYWDVTQSVKSRFDAESISIPFPQRDLHVPGPIEVKLLGERPAGDSIAALSSARSG